MKEGRNNEIISRIVAGTIFLVITFLSFLILRSQLYTNHLLARNEAETIMSLLFSARRAEGRMPNGGPNEPQAARKGGQEFNTSKETEEFIRILRSNPELHRKVTGIAVYRKDGEILFKYGLAPERLRQSELPARETREFPPRHYLSDRESETIAVVMPIPDILEINGDRSQERPRQESPPEGEQRERTSGERKRGHESLLFYFAVTQEKYLWSNRLNVAIFFSWEIFLGISIWAVRRTILKNLDYQRKIQDQQQLVILGSAARTIAHEIKNPLSAIRLQTDVIEKVHPNGVRNELAAINQEVARLRTLVDRMGDFLREPRGAPTRFELSPYVRETVARMAPDIEIDDSEAPDLRVFVDKERFRSVVENLVRNALDSGSDPKDVKIRFRREKNWALMEVMDRGSGLPGVDLEQLFDPFFTTKSKGFGIGLSIAKRFVESAGGSILLGNREGGGTVAEILLPEDNL